MSPFLVRSMSFVLSAIALCAHVVNAAGAPAAEKARFFNAPERVSVYYVRITSMPAGLSQIENLNPRLANEDGKISLKGSRLEIFKLDNAADEEYCPNSQVLNSKPLVSTTNFEIGGSGNATIGTPKSSYKLSLKKDGGPGPAKLFGMKTINLKSMWTDVSQAREALAWHLFESVDVPGPRQAYARLCFSSGGPSSVDFKYAGLYSIIENVDSDFLGERFGGLDGGNLYKAYWVKHGDLGPANLTYVSGDENGKRLRANPNLDARTYRLKTKHDKNQAVLDTYQDLGKFIQILNGRDQAHPDDNYFKSDAFRKNIEAVFDVRRFLRWAAVNSLLGAWDNYWGLPANYYVYNSAPEDRQMPQPIFNWIPWDYDQTLGVTYWNEDFVNADIVNWAKNSDEITAFERNNGNDAPSTQLPLLNNLLKNKTYLAYYLDTMESLINGEFSPALLGAYFDEIWGMISTSAYLEGRYDHHPFVDDQDRPAHTGRHFTNRQVSESGHHGNYLVDGRHKEMGVKDFIQRRIVSVRAQIADLRKHLAN